MRRTEERSELIYYGIGAVLAVRVLGGLGYYIYSTEKGEANAIPQPHP